MTEPTPETESELDTDEPVGPDESEISEEIPDLEEVDPFEVDSSEYDDINAFVESEWSEQTTARQRVQDIITKGRQPMTAGEAADAAEVSEPTARDELNSLADEGVVLAESTTDGMVYKYHPDRRRLERIQAMAERPREALESRRRALDREITQYKEEYEVDSPEDLILERDELSEEAWTDISHWRTASIDRDYVNLAYQFQQLREAEEGLQDGEMDGSNQPDSQLTLDP